MTFYNAAPIRFGVGVSGSTATQGVNDPEIGSRCIVDEVDYLFVYNDGASDLNQGQPCVMSAVTGYSITVSAVTQVDLALGVRLHSTLPASSYGWIAQRGIGVVEMNADESAAVGDLLGLGTEGFAHKSASTGMPTPTIGKAMEAIASGGSGVAYFTML